MSAGIDAKVARTLSAPGKLKGAAVDGSSCQGAHSGVHPPRGIGSVAHQHEGVTLLRALVENHIPALGTQLNSRTIISATDLDFNDLSTVQVIFDFFIREVPSVPQRAELEIPLHQPLPSIHFRCQPSTDILDFLETL